MANNRSSSAAAQSDEDFVYEDRGSDFFEGVKNVIPGLVLTTGIACVAYGLRYIPGVSFLSPMILAILVGILFHNTIGTPASAIPGVKFALRRILRFGIILLGFQLTIDQVIAIGPVGLGVTVLGVVATFTMTIWLGKLMGVERTLSQLIATGTSICGASAVVAAKAATNASDEDAAYGVACVTVFGSIAMFVYPLLPDLLHLAPRAYGLWTGASIHEVAQVVAAAYQDGQLAGDLGTITKLSRVMMLAPMILLLGMFARGPSADGGRLSGVQVPWFVFFFIAMIVVNSTIDIPQGARDVLVPGTVFLLTIALAAMGLETDIKKLRAKGLKPLLLGLIARSSLAF
ncbi:hypothetical protein A7A08_02545 [Methyloligella halotolerans]|uniref:Sulfate exporter family transporter n=1 Tax=Methyloligella halotolerans TaxID=1177755 RepID=A0A1E2RX08_9HYPH|nr:putative sulfate exporter family transporter [Methyloligella halotolerans]ODA66777.1 hypothetical protein A7A08_02545 [Methyloligella halotolerans]